MSEIFDPILAEVMRHELTAVSEEMNITMKQTTRSIVAKEGGDFSAGLLDPEGRVVAQAVPYGLGYFTALMPHIIDQYSGRFQPGDIIISNDPYGGLSHLPDIAVVLPIFWRGEHRGFAAVVQHHTDIGGRFPGGMGLPCAEIYEEGLRLPALRYYEGGKRNDAIQAIIVANVRAPDDVLGDLDAAVAACRRGERGLNAMLDKHGQDNVVACFQHLLAHSEQVMRAALRAIPDGRYSHAEQFDDGNGAVVALKVTLIAEQGAVTIDFTGTGPQLPNALNVPPGMIGNWVANMVFLALLGETEITINSGLFAPITTITEEGSVLRPRFPAAVGSRGQLLWRVTDMVTAALAKAMPERMPAASEGGISMMVFTPADGGGMLTEMYASGWGGRPNSDGIEGVMPVGMSGFRSNPGESIEQELPVMLDGFGFVPDSAGAGCCRGSLAVFRRWRFLAPGRVMLRTCRVDSRPYGLAGGGDGAAFKATLIRDGEKMELPRQIMLDIEVRTGDLLEHVQPGAGGHGLAFARDPQAVLADVLDEKITPDHAEKNYGVAIHDSAIDAAATAALRRGEQV